MLTWNNVSPKSVISYYLQMMLTEWFIPRLSYVKISKTFKNNLLLKYRLSIPWLLCQIIIDWNEKFKRDLLFFSLH